MSSRPAGDGATSMRRLSQSFNSSVEMGRPSTQGTGTGGGQIASVCTAGSNYPGQHADNLANRTTLPVPMLHTLASIRETAERQLSQPVETEDLPQPRVSSVSISISAKSTPRGQTGDRLPSKGTSTATSPRRAIVGNYATQNTGRRSMARGNLKLPPSLQPVPYLDASKRPNSVDQLTPRSIEDNRPGEARRNADGTPLNVVQIIDADQGNEPHDHDELKTVTSHTAAAALQLLGGASSWRTSAIGMKGSVEKHEKRLRERDEVVRALTAWTQDVLANRAPGLLADDMEHVDAEQLEIEARLTDESLRPDPLGMGHQLRAHWNATVQEEVELRFNKMRDAWNNQMAGEMAELAELRTKCKELAAVSRDTKDQLQALQMKYELAMRQGRNVPGAAAGGNTKPQPSTSTAQGTSDTAPGADNNSQTAASNLPDQLITSPENITQEDIAGFVTEIERLRVALSASQQDKSAASQQAAQAIDTLEATLREKKSLQQQLDKAKSEATVLAMKLDESKADMEDLQDKLDKAKKATASTTSSKGGQSSSSPGRERDASAPSSSNPSRQAAKPGMQRNSSPQGRQTSPRRNAEPSNTSPTSPSKAGGKAAGPSSRSQVSGSAGSQLSSLDEQHAVTDDRSDALRQQVTSLRSEGDALRQNVNTLTKQLEAKTSEIAQLASEVAELRVKMAHGGGDHHDIPNSTTAANTPTTPRGHTNKTHESALIARATKAEADLLVAKSNIQNLEQQLQELRSQSDKQQQDRSSTSRASHPQLQLEVAVEVEKARRQQLLAELQADIASGLQSLTELVSKSHAQADNDSGSDESLASLRERVDQLAALLQSIMARHQEGLGLTENGQHGMTAGSIMNKRPFKLKQTELQGLLASSAVKLQQLMELGGLPAVEGGRLSQQPTAILNHNPLLPNNKNPSSNGNNPAVPSSYSQRLNQWLSSVYGSTHAPEKHARMSGNGGSSPQLTLDILDAQPRYRVSLMNMPFTSSTAADTSLPPAIPPTLLHRATETDHQKPPMPTTGGHTTSRFSSRMSLVGDEFMTASRRAADAAQLNQPSNIDSIGIHNNATGDLMIASPQSPRSPRSLLSSVPEGGDQRQAPGQAATGSNLSNSGSCATDQSHFQRNQLTEFSPSSSGNVQVHTVYAGSNVSSVRRPQSAMPMSRGWEHTPHLERPLLVRPCSANPGMKPKTALDAQAKGAFARQHAAYVHAGALQGDVNLAHDRRPALWDAQQLHEAEAWAKHVHAAVSSHGTGPQSSSTKTALDAARDASMSWQALHITSPDQTIRPSSPPNRCSSPPKSATNNEHSTTPSAPLVVQQQPGGVPAAMKHNIYQQQAPDGGFKVRLITATPQKGINYPARLERPLSPKQTGAMVLEPGQGPPQVPPPVPATMLSSRVPTAVGLSVASHTWSLTSGVGGPAGALLHTPGADKPAVTSVELMTRLELLHTVKRMHMDMDDMHKRYAAMNEEMTRTQGIRTELATEVAEARQHWVAENQYNALLQEELQRMSSILEVITATAADSPEGEAPGSKPNTTSADANEKTATRSRKALSRSPTKAQLATLADDPVAVQQAKELLVDLERVMSQQDEHASMQTTTGQH